MVGNGPVEFLLGGMATCGACLITNPLEVVKTRMQLQGELRTHGEYVIHYRNAFHAFVTIARSDGLLALQNGLVPALWYNFFMNGTRLGTYQVQINLGLTKDKDGNNSFIRCVAAGAFAGCVGAVIGSPFYLIFKPNSVMATFAASMVGGLVATLLMTPFDVVSTRLYNQPVNQFGHGAIYSGVLNCFSQTFRSEGLWGFYKGWGHRI